MTNVIHVHAAIDRTDDRWLAEVFAPDELKGVFAFGTDVTSARQELAGVVALALHPDPTDRIRVYAMTRKTFTVGDLK